MIPILARLSGGGFSILFIGVVVILLVLLIGERRGQ